MCNCWNSEFIVRNGELYGEYDGDFHKYDDKSYSFCPICGENLQPERLNPRAPQGDAIVQPYDESVRGKSEAVCPPYQDGHEK
jgi:hypothetical protein